MAQFDSDEEPEYAFGIHDDQGRSLEELIKHQEEGSFEDYLTKKGGDRWPSKQTSAESAEDSSRMSIPSNPIPGQSFGRGAAPVVDAPSPTAKAMNLPNYVENGHRTEPVHPVAPMVEVIEEEGSTPVAQETNETRTVLEVRHHEITGQYLVETVEAVAKDDRWAQIFLDSKKIGVTEMSAEQIIERTHQLDQAIEDMKTQKQGLRAALEEHLLKSNGDRKRQILEKDQQYRRAKNKADGPVTEKKKSVPKTSAKGKTPGMKAADTLKGLGMTREEVKATLIKQGRLDEGTQTYLDTLTF